VGIRISQDGGSTWKSGATDYYFGGYSTNYSPGGNVAYGSATTYGYIGTQNTANALPASGIIRFNRPFDTAGKKQFLVDVSAGQTTYFRNTGSFFYGTDNNAINGLRILNATTGNIAAGTFILYGIKK